MPTLALKTALAAALAGGCAASAALAAPLGAPVAARAPSSLEREVILARAAIRANPSAALAHARTALTLAAHADASLPQRRLGAAAAWLAGEASARLEQPAEALAYLDLASRRAAASGPGDPLPAEISLAQGRAEAVLGRVAMSLHDYEAALAAFKRLGRPQGEALALADIGTIYLRAREYPRALEYYDQATRAFSGNTALGGFRENNRGAILKEMGRYKEAEAAFRSALGDAEATNNASLKAHVLTNIALAEIRQGHLGEARRTLAEGMAAAASRREASEEKPFLLAAAADLAETQHDARTAARDLDRAFDGVDLSRTSFSWIDSHALAAKVYDEAGSPRLALQHLRAFKRLDDAGRELAASTEAAIVGAKFDFARQKATIARLEADSLKRDIALAQARSRFLLVLGLVVAVAALLVIAVLQRALLASRRSRIAIEGVNRELASTNKALEKAMNVKNEFLAMTSHEIRTPLNGILGMTQVMLAEASLDAEVKSRLEVIRASGVTMNEMLTDLLDIAKIEKGQLTVSRAEFDLRDFVREAARMWGDQAKTKGLTFKVAMDNCPERIIEDRTVLRQILTNLLSNAVKFTQSGEVCLRVRASQDARPTLTFEVSDTGIGIPQAEYDRVFEAFTQVDGGTSRAFGGTGLGLAICRNLTQALNGALSLKSGVGVGTTFTVELPLNEVARTAAASPNTAALERATILAFEDNPLAQAMLRLALKDKVRHLAFSQTWDLAPEGPGDAPDVILLDGAALQRRAPGDPFCAIAEVRTRRPSAPMLVLWPAMTEDELSRLLAMGVDAALAKPVTAMALVEALEAICLRRRGAPAGVERDAA